MRRTRVAYLIYDVGLGGGELLLANHMTHADRTAFDPLVVCTGEGALPDRLRHLGVAVFMLPMRREVSVFGRLSLPIPSTAWRLARLLRREGVGLIHSYTMETRNYAHAAALLTGCPVIHTCQDFWSGDMFRPIQWWMMNRLPSRIIVISETARRGLHVGTDLNPARVTRISPGVDLARFRPRDERTAVRGEFGLAPDTPLIGIVGRFSAVKGFDTFFASAALVSGRLPGARFLVVGGAVLRDDDYSAEIRQAILRHGLEGRVILTGYRDDVPRLLAGLDVLVSASPRETFPIVLMEAAACGRPAVATRSGGAEEIVADDETGLLVPVGDPPAMAEAIAALVADPTRASTMGRAARQRAEAHFDLIRMVRQVEAEYRAVLAEYAGGPDEDSLRAKMSVIS